MLCYVAYIVVMYRCVTCLLLGRLFFDEDDVNQFSNSELILKELDDIDVESSTYALLLCAVCTLLFYKVIVCVTVD